MASDTAAPAPTTSKKSPSQPRDLRPLSERWCAIKRRLLVGCIAKNGRMEIQNVKINFLMNDDVQELIREMMGEEGIDVRVGMDPNFPPTEKIVKTTKGVRYEYQCWFKITATCSIEGGKDEDCEYMWEQDADVDIASTYAHKNYLIKRLQLSGGNADGVRWADVEPMAQQPAAAAEPGKPAPLQISDAEAKKASVAGQAETSPKAKGGAKKADGAAKGPAKEDFTPEHFANPASSEEIKGAWGALSKVQPTETKAKLLELIGRDIANLSEMTVGDCMKTWEWINAQTPGSEAGF